MDTAQGRQGAGPGGFRAAAGGIVVACAAYAVWLLLRPDDSEAATAFDDLVGVAAAVFATVLCARAAIRAQGATRRAWALLTAAAASWGLGEVAWTVYEVALDREVPFPSVADAGYLALIPFACAGLLAFPGAPRGWRRGLGTVLDGLVAAGSILVVMWVVLLAEVYRTTEGGWVERVIALTYPAGDVMLVAVAVAVVRHLPKGRRLAPALVGGAVVLLAVADVAFAFLTANDDYSTGALTDVGWFGAFLVLGLASLAPTVPGASRRRVDARRFPALTYAALAAAMVASGAQYSASGFVHPFVFWGGSAVVLMAVARALLALREREVLLATAERGVGDLERASARLREAQQLARIGSWEWDVATDTVTWSEELYRLFNVPLGRFQPSYGGYLAQVERTEVDTVTAAVGRALTTGEPFEFEHGVVGAPGRRLHCHGRVERDAEGAIVRMAGTAQDVTELRELAAALSRQVAELERSTEDLGRIATFAAQDVKAPIQVVSGYLELLRRTTDPARAEELIDGAQRGMQRMVELIDDILTYSMVATEREEIVEPVRLASAVAESATAVRAMSPDAAITTGELPTVHANPSQVRQLVQSLLTNAVKFVPEGRIPEVSVTAAEEDGEWHVTVEDNGLGIDPAECERVFEMFERGSSHAAGTGIGLAICRRIVERHGGRIWMAPRVPGPGTRVTFTLPARPSWDGSRRVHEGRAPTST